MKKNPNAIKDSKSDKVFYVCLYILFSIILLLVIYPVYFIIVASVSDPTYVNNGHILLYPKGFTTLGYEKIFQDTKIWIGYLNTIVYTVGGTFVGLLFSIPAGYALSRKDMPYKGTVMGILVFTMYFSGGLIPSYLVVQSLGLMDSRFLMIIMGSVSVYNIILIRSFFISSLPQELCESASIDGCTTQRFFISIAVPLSKPIIAVIGLYLAVSQWNAYFTPMIYLSSTEKFPLQLVLTDILSAVSTASKPTDDLDLILLLAKMAEVVKYGVIIVSTLPILLIYPFIQKYFVKGVMIGAIKG